MLALPLAAALAATAGPPAGVQLPGLFHGDETVARDGERWLALVDDAQGARLRAVRVRVTPTFDPVLDAEGDTTARTVEAPAGIGDGLVAFLRGPQLQARAVIRATVENTPDGDGLPGARLQLGDRAYALETHCVAAPVPENVSALRCTLALTSQGRRQPLVDMDGGRTPGGVLQLGDDASPHLIFAGDLDGDGALDLLYDITDHYNVAQPTLFLSGAAGKGELVHAVAGQRSTGC